MLLCYKDKVESVIAKERYRVKRMKDSLEKYKNFKFPEPGVMIDGELELVLKETCPHNPIKGFVPAYKFQMVNSFTKDVMGIIDLRVGLTEKLKEFGGHIGYEVDEKFRGNGYAARSCRLLFPLIRQLGINPVVITCDPKNIPSAKTIESLGARLMVTKEVEIGLQMHRLTSIYQLYL